MGNKMLGIHGYTRDLKYNYILYGKYVTLFVYVVL
jgi:hypothetical protein